MVEPTLRYEKVQPKIQLDPRFKVLTLMSDKRKVFQSFLKSHLLEKKKQKDDKFEQLKMALNQNEKANGTLSADLSLEGFKQMVATLEIDLKLSKQEENSFYHGLVDPLKKKQEEGTLHLDFRMRLYSF